MGKRILLLLAHPDDETFGPAGTIAKYADEDVARYIRANERRLSVKYLDYDWRLNDIENKPEEE